MRAILLCAGQGRRLGKDHPKCLVEIEGKSLLERHLANMSAAGIDRATVVVGFMGDKIRSALARLPLPFEIEIVDNPKFTLGNVVSLQVVGDRLLDGAIWMDADVLYPAALLKRLVDSKHDNCVLVNPKSHETGEEMMVGIRDGRAQRIARRVGEGWELRGETCGFTKVGSAGGRAMKEMLDLAIAEGKTNDEYEAVMDRIFPSVIFGFERVDDFPWTEIDFEEDIEKAKRIVARVEA